MKKRIYTAGSILLTAAVMVCSIPVMAQHADNRSFAAGTGFLAAKGIVPKAILAAAEAAGKETGGDPDALQQKKEDEQEKKEKKKKEEEILDAELVIVGGGGAGMTAAIRARQLGVDVILVEKQPFLGGTIAVSGGNQVITDSRLQEECGVTDDSTDSMIADFMSDGDELNVPELLTLYAENVGETSDWLQENGVTYDTESGLHSLAEYSHDRELAYTGGGAGAAKALRNLVDESGAEVLLNTRATELITDDDGSVTGVIAEDDDTVYNIYAEAVLLATGGYGNNKDLLPDELKKALYYGLVTSTGDGLIMACAEGIDADTCLMEYGKRYPNGIEVEEGIARSTIAGNLAAWNMAAILVNKDGARVVNEKASNREILEKQLEEEDQTLYLVMDDATFTEWCSRLSGAGISKKDIKEYLKANGTKTPVFAHGETLEEAAEAAGVDPDGLAAAVERYNGFVEAGEDRDFGRAPEYMTAKIENGPFYIIEQKPRFATTLGGLVVDTDLEVMNRDGNEIPGLYAAGEVVGGVMGDDSPSGANNGWAVTSGRLAAQSIAKELGLYGEESGSVPDGQAAVNGTESGQEGMTAAQSFDPDADVHDPAAPDQAPDGGSVPSKPVPEAVPVPIYKPGIYTASADGMNGPVVLTVEFSDSEILSITCEDDETPELGGMAIAELTEQVLQYQGINFDSVSGATITSDAFRTALMKCQQQAFLQ